MNNWLKALKDETWPAFLTFISALSTLSSFVFPSLPRKFGLTGVITTLGTFAYANYRVFLKQADQISRLRSSLALHEQRIARLRVFPTGQSRYMLSPVNNIPNADFNGGHFEFHLRIENSGRRNASITDYSVEIVTLDRIFDHLPPIEGHTLARSRVEHQGLNPTQILSETGIVNISAESTTPNGTLLFYIPDLNLEAFARAGLRMSGIKRRFGDLQCRLRIQDSSGTSTSQDFSLAES